MPVIHWLHDCPDPSAAGVGGKGASLVRLSAAGFPGSAIQLIKLTASQVGVAPLPTFAGQSSPGYSTIGGWNMYINPHSKNLNADLTFIKFLSGTTAQDILSEKYGFISTVTAVRSAPATIASNPNFAVVPKTRLVPRPAGTPEYPALSTAIYSNVNGALAGSASPAAAVAAMQSGASTSLSSTSSGGL